MTSAPGSRPVQLQVNLAVVEGHYRDALRPHLRGRARAAYYAAIRDIPHLLDEIERLRTLLTEVRIRHANLRAAALATMSAYDAHEIDRCLTYARDCPRTTGEAGAQAAHRNSELQHGHGPKGGRFLT